MGPDRNRSEPNRTGSASVYTGPFWNRSGTDPNGCKIRPAKKQFQFWIRSGPVPKRPHVACSKRSDSGDGANWVKQAVRPFSRVFFACCSPRRCPILRAFPHYVNAWNRLSRINRRPIRSDFRTGSFWIRLEPVLCNHSLRGSPRVQTLAPV